MNDLNGINEIVNTDSIYKLYMLFMAATFIILFWIVEAIWRDDKRAVLVILLLPVTLVYYTFKHWQKTKGRCFFAALLLVMITLIGFLTNYGFAEQILNVLGLVAVWPYHAYVTLLKPS